MGALVSPVQMNEKRSIDVPCIILSESHLAPSAHLSYLVFHPTSTKTRQTRCRRLAAQLGRTRTCASTHTLSSVRDHHIHSPYTHISIHVQIAWVVDVEFAFGGCSANTL